MLGAIRRPLEDTIRFIIRGSPEAAPISIDEWTAYIASSPLLKRTAAREGINPFTKKPVQFHPAAGSAYFDAAEGRCSFAFRHGEIITDAATAHSDAIVAIARDLGAVVQQ